MSCRHLLSVLTLLCCLPAGLRAQSSTFRFEGAAETRAETHTRVEDSTSAIGLTVASMDSDWQARDVDGYANTTGRAAYAVVGTQQVTLTFSQPVHVVALHAAVVYRTETWTLTDGNGTTRTVDISGIGRRVALDFPDATSVLTITSSSGTFFPILDDIEIAHAQVETSTDRDKAITGAPAISVYPQPLAAQGRLRLGAFEGPVRVSVFDLVGRAVRVLHDGPVEAGHTLALDARGLAGGTYLVAVDHPGGRVTQPFVVAR